MYEIHTARHGRHWIPPKSQLCLSFNVFGTSDLWQDISDAIWIWLSFLTKNCHFRGIIIVSIQNPTRILLRSAAEKTDFNANFYFLDHWSLDPLFNFEYHNVKVRRKVPRRRTKTDSLPTITRSGKQIPWTYHVKTWQCGVTQAGTKCLMCMIAEGFKCRSFKSTSQSSINVIFNVA